jgi:hypothetical protein
VEEIRDRGLATANGLAEVRPQPPLLSHSHCPPRGGGEVGFLKGLENLKQNKKTGLEVRPQLPLPMAHGRTPALSLTAPESRGGSLGVLGFGPS